MVLVSLSGCEKPQLGLFTIKRRTSHTEFHLLYSFLFFYFVNFFVLFIHFTMTPIALLLAAAPAYAALGRRAEDYSSLLGHLTDYGYATSNLQQYTNADYLSSIYNQYSLGDYSDYAIPTGKDASSALAYASSIYAGLGSDFTPAYGSAYAGIQTATDDDSGASATGGSDASATGGSGSGGSAAEPSKASATAPGNLVGGGGGSASASASGSGSGSGSGSKSSGSASGSASGSKASGSDSASASGSKSGSASSSGSASGGSSSTAGGGAARSSQYFGAGGVAAVAALVLL
ncbi:hypothetical protein SBP28_002767 [Candidozyma auris]